MASPGPVTIQSKVELVAPRQTRDEWWSEVESRDPMPGEKITKDPGRGRGVVVGRIKTETGKAGLPTIGRELDLAGDQNCEELEAEILG